MRLKTLPIFLAFLLMGVADAMGPLSDAVQKNFELTNVMATLMSFFVFIAFAIFSVPGGLLAARIGKKKVLLLGLILNAAAMGIPAFFAPSYYLLLSCIFVLGVGTTFLQVAANPIMRDISAEGDYSRNLALAQGIKGIGSSASAFLPSVVGAIGFLTAMGWRGSFPIFFALMALAVVAVAMVPVKETKAAVPPSIGSSLRLLAAPTFFLAVVGIFLYVGAEVCMARFLKPTLAGLGLSDKESAAFGATLFFACLTIGRLVAGVIKVSPRTFFRLSGALGLIGTAMLMSGIKPLALTGVVLGGFGFANIWPMLFSITVEEKPECANELSGLMCMAISGGALVPLLMAGALDNFTNRFSKGATVAQADSGAAGTVLNWDQANSTLTIAPQTGSFTGTNVIRQTAPVAANARPVAPVWKVEVKNGQFEKDSTVTQTASGAVGTVQKWDKDSKTLTLTPVTGTFNTKDEISQEQPTAASAIPVVTDFSYKIVPADGGFAFCVPAACFAYLLLLSLRGGRKSEPTPVPAKAQTPA